MNPSTPTPPPENESQIELVAKFKVVAFDVEERIRRDRHFRFRNYCLGTLLASFGWIILPDMNSLKD